MSSLFTSPQACIILTGASRGFGAALATTFAQHYRDTQSSTDESSSQILLFILVARNGQQLKIVRDRLKVIDSRIQVQTIVADLSTVEGMKTLEDSLSSILSNKSQIEQFILLHNAGSTGDVKQRVESVSSNESLARDAYYRLNLFSVMELTGLFLRLTKSKEQASVSSPKKTQLSIVNISSLAAVQPFTGLVDYCTGKAAREAYFRSVLHEVEEDDKEASSSSSLRLLNYAPGPLETEMFAELQDDSLVSQDFQKVIPLTTTQSAEKLVKIMAANQFLNGTHVDYYDDE